MEALRVCRTCGEPKSHGEYWRQPGRRDGLQAECKACMSARHAGWRAKNSTPEFLADKVEGVRRARKGNPRAQLLRQARERAKRKGIAFSLTVEDIEWVEVCPVLGIPLRYGGWGGFGGKPDSASLDRIDNAKGYVPGNVAVISDRANRIKGNATADELEAIARWMREAANAQP